MNSMQQKTKLYRIIVDILTVSPEYRASLVDSALERCNLPKECLSDQSADSKKNNLRGELGALINEMHAAALIGIDKNGAYYIIFCPSITSPPTIHQKSQMDPHVASKAKDLFVFLTFHHPSRVSHNRIQARCQVGYRVDKLAGRALLIKDRLHYLCRVADCTLNE